MHFRHFYAKIVFFQGVSPPSSNVILTKNSLVGPPTNSSCLSVFESTLQLVLHIVNPRIAWSNLAQWRVAVFMTRSFLAEASLSKRFWFFWRASIPREATLHMNVVPCPLQGTTKTYATPFAFLWGEAQPTSARSSHLVVPLGTIVAPKSPCIYCC